MDNITLFFLIFSLNGRIWTLDNLMIFAAQYLIYLTILMVFVLSFKGGTKERKAMLLAFLALPIAVLLIKAIHLIFFEPRPFVDFHFSPLISHNADASFPSRHAAIMSVVAFSYTYLKSKWAPVLLFFMLWVGAARIFVGVHFPQDIIGGFVVGLISLIIALQIIKLIKLRFLT